MEFLHPGILWGLLALLIPVIIHLFYFRRFKKIEFSNVRFLKEIKEETSSRNKLKNLLVLLCRLLALAALVLAFAQPFLNDGKALNKGSNAVSIFIDNSFSMRALSSDIPLFDKAKLKAKEIVEAYGNEDQFQIIAHDLGVKQQRLLTKEDALSAIDDLEIGPSVNGLNKIYQRQIQAIENSGERSILYYLSDFQKSICDLEIVQDSLTQVNFVPFQSVQEKNVTIDSVWLAAPAIIPNQTNKLVVRLFNHSDVIAEDVKLSLRDENGIQPLGLHEVPARSSVIDTANVNVLKTGWRDLTLSISDYPIEFDNEYLISFEVPKTKKILSINQHGRNKYLSSAFEGISYFTLENSTVSKLQFDKLNQFDLIVLNELTDLSSGLISELSNYIISGGNVLMFPSKTGNLTSYNQLSNALAADEYKSLVTTENKVSTLNTQDFIFSDVYLKSRRNLKLPTTQSNFELSNYSNRGRQDLLKYRNGKPYLSKYRKGNGYYYLCTSPLDTKENDLALNAEVFVPMLYKMSLAKFGSSVGAYTIGQNQNIAIPKRKGIGESSFMIKGSKEFIPQQSILSNEVVIGIQDQIDEPGFYQLFLKEDKIKHLAFNYDRKESDLRYLGLNDLKNTYGPQGVEIIEGAESKNFAQFIGDKANGIALWKWCLILALIFLGLESLIIRFWKK